MARPSSYPVELRELTEGVGVEVRVAVAWLDVTCTT
jgi:hypothetical protein